MSETQAFEDSSRRIGAIERVKVNAAHFMFQKIVTLFGSVVNAHTRDAFWIVLASMQGAQEPGRKPRSRGEFGHASHPANRCNRHYSGNDGNIDACQLASVAKIQKIPVIEEKLRDNVVRSGVDLLLEVIHLQEPIWRGRMAFGKSRNANPESAPVRMNLQFVEFPNEPHQIGRMLEIVIRLPVFQAFAGVAPSERMLLTPALA